MSKYTGNIKTKNNNLIWDKLVDITIWPYWRNDSNNKMYNTLNEFKFSINKNCIENMPDFKTEIPNLYFGSVIVKGDQPMISQEMACTNGRKIGKLFVKNIIYLQLKLKT